MKNDFDPEQEIKRLLEVKRLNLEHIRNTPRSELNIVESIPFPDNWDEYKTQMDEVLLSRGVGGASLTITPGMTKNEMRELLKLTQENVRNRYTDSDEDGTM